MSALVRRKRQRPGWEKTTKYLYYRCVRLHGKPREVAFGLALGLLVGFSPTMGFQMVIAVVLATLLGQNKLAAALGVWITNPLTAPVIYSLTYSVGAWILGMPLRPPEGFWHALTDVGNLTHHIFAPLWIGGFVVGIPVAALGWWITYEAVIAYRLKVKHRKANRLHRWKWSPHHGWYRESLASPSHRPSDGTGVHDSASGGGHG
ncbi:MULTISPECIES: DUF2062 domain-containing protein [Deferrisoma]